MRWLLAGCLIAGTVFGSGCAKDPGSMSKSGIEAKLKDTLEFKEVTFTEVPEGGYLGTGKNEEGTKYTITVTQKKEDKSLWYTAEDDKSELKASGFKKY